MRTMNQFILLFVFLLFGACSKKATTPAAFKLVLGAAALDGASAPGGLALYGHNTSTGEKFGRVFQPPYSDISLELNNGSWDFKAIVWTGTKAMTGIPKCGVANAVEVAGVDIDINLDIISANCSTYNSHFVPSASHIQSLGGGDYSFNYTKLFACSSFEDANLAVGSSSNCNQVSVNNPEFLPSYKIALKSYGADLGAPTYLTSECITANNISQNGYTSDESWIMAGTEESGPTYFFNAIPYGGVGLGINTEIFIYEGEDCSGSASSPLKKIANYPDGLAGAAPDMDIETAVSGSYNYTHLAVNFTGAGYSPLWAIRPIHKCYNGVTEISCTPEQSIQAKALVEPSSTRSVYIKAPDQDNDTTCSGATVAGSVLSSATITSTPFLTVESGEKFCVIDVSSTAITSSSAGVGTVTVSFDYSGTSTIQIYVENRGGTWQKAHSMKTAAFSVAGYKDMPTVNIYNEAQFEMHQGPDEGSDYNGIIKELSEEFSADAYGGLLYKAGYSTCQDLMNGIGNQHSMTIYDDEDDVTENITFKLLAGTKSRPAFMDNVNSTESAAASNATLDMRIEIWEDGILDTEIEFDCENNPARSQVFVSVNYSEDDRNEKRAYYISANRDDLNDSSYGVSLPPFYSHSSGDVEVEMVSVDGENLHYDDDRGEWTMREDRRIIKYHHVSTGTPLTKVWMSSSSKNINYDTYPPSGYRHQWFLSRGVARITPVNGQISFTFDSMGDDGKEIISQGSPPSSFMITSAPAPGDCHAEADPKNILMNDLEAIEVSPYSSVTSEPSCDFYYTSVPNVEGHFPAAFSTALMGLGLSTNGWSNPPMSGSSIISFTPSVTAFFDGTNCDISINFTAFQDDSDNYFGSHRCSNFATQLYGIDENESNTSFTPNLSADRATVTGSTHSGGATQVVNEMYDLTNLQYVSSGTITGGDYTTSTSAFDDGVNPLQFNMDYITSPTFEADQF